MSVCLSLLFVFVYKSILADMLLPPLSVSCHLASCDLGVRVGLGLKLYVVFWSMKLVLI